MLFTRMAGSGQAASSASWPSGRRDVTLDGGHLAAAAARDLVRRRSQCSAVSTIDHHLAAGMCERQGASAAEPAAGGADNGFAPGDAKIHGIFPVANRRSGLRFRDIWGTVQMKSAEASHITRDLGFYVTHA